MSFSTLKVFAISMILIGLQSLSTNAVAQSESKDWLMMSWSSIVNTSTQQVISVTEKQCRGFLDAFSKMQRYPVELKVLCVSPSGEWLTTETLSK